MKRVPEGKTVPSCEEQLRVLQEKLAGHQIFARHRGKMKNGLIVSVSDVIERAATPTAFCKAWDRQVGEMRVLGTLLTRFIRNGWVDAAEALSAALVDPAYFFPGETIPIEQTTPMTVLIVDFPRTLAMIKWIRAGHWMDLDRFLDGHVDNELVRDLFAQFPSLRKHTERRQRAGEYEGHDLVAAYKEDVLDPAREILQGFPLDTHHLSIADATYNDHLEVGVMGSSIPLGILFFEEQDAVLRRIPRALQSHVATWHCRIPTALLTEGRKTYFGFHPEDRHSEWEREPRAFPSAGCSHGYGMVVLNFGNEAMRKKYLMRYNREMMGAGYCHIQEGEGFAFALDTR